MFSKGANLIDISYTVISFRTEDLNSIMVLFNGCTDTVFCVTLIHMCVNTKMNAMAISK